MILMLILCRCPELWAARSQVRAHTKIFCCIYPVSGGGGVPALCWLTGSHHPLTQTSTRGHKKILYKIFKFFLQKFCVEDSMTFFVTLMCFI